MFQSLINWEFRPELLKGYLTHTDLYIGLWKSSSFLPGYSGTYPASGIYTADGTIYASGYPFLFDNINASTFIDNLEISYGDYNRLKIPKEDWYIDELETEAETNRIYAFAPYIYNWVADGFFITTDYQGSNGVLVLAEQFKTTYTIPANTYLEIRPEIFIYGDYINAELNEIATLPDVLYLADGTYYGNNSIEAKGSSLG